MWVARKALHQHEPNHEGNGRSILSIQKTVSYVLKYILKSFYLLYVPEICLHVVRHHCKTGALPKRQFFSTSKIQNKSIASDAAPSPGGSSTDYNLHSTDSAASSLRAAHGLLSGSDSSPSLCNPFLSRGRALTNDLTVNKPRPPC